jgi:hypothetical protein
MGLNGNFIIEREKEQQNTWMREIVYLSDIASGFSSVSFSLTLQQNILSFILYSNNERQTIAFFKIFYLAACFDDCVEYSLSSFITIVYKKIEKDI